MPGVTHLIISAVEDYNNPNEFPKVPFAGKDASDVIAAFKLLGFGDDDVVSLIDKKATKAAITEHLRRISEKAAQDDRIVFYFAGHGAYENGENLIACVDAMKTSKKATCVSVGEIMALLRTSKSRHKILFLDCCHSGLEAGDFVRDEIDSFEADELVFMYRNEEYFSGFASCKSNENSVSNPQLQNGVWSHYLVKALRGDGGNIYEKGLLFSDKLQSYLRIETSQYVKMNTSNKRDQTPIKFGSETDRFIIADLNPVFEERDLRRKAAETNLTNVFLSGESIAKIDRLPGFVKNSHKVPNSINSSANSFVVKIGAEVLKNEISDIGRQLVDTLRFKRKQIRPTIDDDSGSIETPFFDYSIRLSQSNLDATKYKLEYRLENFKEYEIDGNDAFNSVFSNRLNRLVFELDNPINVEALIDRIEDLEDHSGINVKYDPQMLDTCTIKIDGLSYDIEVSSSSFNIKLSFLTGPQRLIEAYKKTQEAILSHPEMKLLL
jgi:Caspase domain